MTLKTLVKVHSINNLSEARFCAGIGVELLGFNFHPERGNCLGVQEFHEITNWLSGVQFVGEFFDASPAEIENIVSSVSLQYVETTRPENLKWLKTLGVPLILRLELEPSVQMEEIVRTMEVHRDSVEYFLLDGEYPNPMDLAGLGASDPILLGIGIRIETLDNLLSVTPGVGIALHGSREIRPGYFDFDEMAEILESIEMD